MKKHIYLILSLGIVSILLSCSKDEDGNTNSINLFSLKQDIPFGKQLVDHIESDSSDFVVLEPSDYPVAYSHINRIRDKILNSGAVKHRDDFEWRIRIIQDDETLNAFCAPGGYIYVYTGIIKYLDDEYSLAGVLGHEIAHAAERHSTNQMTKKFGISLMLAVVGGDSSVIAQMTAGLLLLKYGRADETEADQRSVDYLCPTTYKADGAAQFFRKIGSSPVPTFLSTHPDPENRVENIEARAKSKGCMGTDSLGLYLAFKNSLPK